MCKLTFSVAYLCLMQGTSCNMCPSLVLFCFLPVFGCVHCFICSCLSQAQRLGYKMLSPIVRITAKKVRLIYYFSSGSRNFGEGGPRNMKYKLHCAWRPSFFGLFFTGQGGGGHGPLGPPPWIRYCISYLYGINFF